MAKAVCVANANLLSEGTLVLSDGRSLDQLARISQVAQGNQTVIEGRRPTDESHAASCNLITQASGLASSCPLGSDLFHKDILLEVVVGPVAQQNGRFDRQPPPDSTQKLMGTAARLEHADLQFTWRGVVVAV